MIADAIVVFWDAWPVIGLIVLGVAAFIAGRMVVRGTRERR